MVHAAKDFVHGMIDILARYNDANDVSSCRAQTKIEIRQVALVSVTASIHSTQYLGPSLTSRKEQGRLERIEPPLCHVFLR